MFAPGYSFRLLSKKKDEEARQNPEPKKEERISEDTESDSKKRSFLKLAGVVGVGALATTLLPKKAEALVFGSTPTSNVVGLKDHNNARIDPAQETGGNLATIAANIPAKGQAAMTASLPVVIASDQTPIPVTGTFTGGSGIDPVGLKDSTSTRINPSTEDSLILLRRIAKSMESLTTIDSSQRMKVNIDAGTLPTVTTVTTVSTVSAITNYTAGATLTSLSQLAGVDARYLYIDTARNAYANGMRPYVSW